MLSLTQRKGKIGKDAGITSVNRGMLDVENGMHERTELLPVQNHRHYGKLGKVRGWVWNLSRDRNHTT
jgi:hypothetical protein